MSDLENRITNEDLISSRCLFNNELRYRSIEHNPKVKGKQEQYCLLGDSLCPYYEQAGQKDLCRNYDTKYK